MNNKVDKSPADLYPIGEYGTQMGEIKGMPKVKFLPSGTEVEIPEGKILLDAALDSNVKIDHNCGGNCACSTCHVIIEEGYETLNEMSEDEEDMLDELENLSETSRLACQCRVTSDLVVRIPEKDPLFDDEA